MNTMFLKLIVKLHDLSTREEGQDLVEYGLLLALISTAAIASAGKVATAINTIFTNISTSLA
jgi:Flp pilus assembly pilin Flp